jgi:hypothetical protein
VCSSSAHNAHSNVNKLWAVAQAQLMTVGANRGQGRGQNRGQTGLNRPKQTELDDSQLVEMTRASIDSSGS